MKRYRIQKFDIDGRLAVFLNYKQYNLPIKEIMKVHPDIILSYINQYGNAGFEQKFINLLDIGTKPVSVIAYHNKFLEQIRNSFVIGSYYPALTASCALGERILNRLILNLRDNFKSTPEYKHVYKKKSFDNWQAVIDTLDKWKVLSTNAVTDFYLLEKIRNQSIHFNIETEENDRTEALTAIKLIQSIIDEQFTAYGVRPWFITSIPGEIYIKKAYENDPFIKLIYLPNCSLLGYQHKIIPVPNGFKNINSYFIINDNFNYPDKEITDEEFARLRNK